jgi:Uma2 family endonuclease
MTDPGMMVRPELDLPKLENGDHLTREEFELRYHAMPHLTKAELIEGVVYMPSPVRWKQHASPHGVVMTWLGSYTAKTPGVQFGDNGTVRLDPENMPQPDAILIIDPSRGGQTTLSADDYLEGAPELVVEIAASSVSIDLNLKLRVYRRNKVREYLVWRTQDQTLDWFILRGDDYERLEPGADGIVRSEVFPGLWLDPAALASSDLGRVLEILQQGIASPEHAAFVKQLDEHRDKSSLTA